MSQRDREQMARLAQLERREAELHGELAELKAKRAQILEGFAEGETVELPTLRRRPRASAPAIGAVSELAQKRAQGLLRAGEHRRRLGR